MIGGMKPPAAKPKKQRIWAEENYGRGPGKPRPRIDPPAPEVGFVGKVRNLLGL